MSGSTPLKPGAVPKYAQLEERLRGAIADLEPGRPIPSERSLMDRFGVSRSTVRRAIANLVRDGVLIARGGQGTFVAEPRVESNLHLASFTQDMLQRGCVPSTVVLSLRREDADGDALAFFGSRLPVWCLERVRRADGEPMAYEIQWIRQELTPDLGARDLRGSVYAMLAEEYDCAIDSADQVMWGTTADERLASLLDVPVGAALLVFDRRSRSRGRPVEAVRSWYRADRYRVHMSLDASMRG